MSRLKFHDWDDDIALIRREFYKKRCTGDLEKFYRELGKLCVLQDWDFLSWGQIRAAGKNLGWTPKKRLAHSNRLLDLEILTRSKNGALLRHYFDAGNPGQDDYDAYVAKCTEVGRRGALKRWGKKNALKIGVPKKNGNDNERLEDVRSLALDGIDCKNTITCDANAGDAPKETAPTTRCVEGKVKENKSPPGDVDFAQIAKRMAALARQRGDVGEPEAPTPQAKPRPQRPGMLCAPLPGERLGPQQKRVSRFNPDMAPQMVNEHDIAVFGRRLGIGMDRRDELMMYEKMVRGREFSVAIAGFGIYQTARRQKDKTKPPLTNPLGYAFTAARNKHDELAREGRL